MPFSHALAGRVTDRNAKWWTLAATCFGLFMALLDNLVVNVAMPTIAVDLDAGTTQLQWIVSAYTPAFASLQITAGGLGDRLGRKRWFLIGLALFTATSLLAALSQTIEMLILVRALQGVGAAFVMPLSLSLISAAFPSEERAKAVGLWGAIAVSSVALGPIVGGAVVEYLTWEWVFLLNVPIGLGELLVTAAVVRESKDESGTVAIDVPGTLLITGAIAALTYGLIDAGERGWGDGLILSMFGLAALLGAAFVLVEHRTERPMVPLRFFRSTTFVGANLDAFTISFLITGIVFFLTLYQQNIHGFSPIETGLALLPLVAVQVAVSPLAGSLTNRVGPRRLLTAGMVVTGVGSLLLLRSGPEASYLDILPAFLVVGLGMAFVWIPMTTAVLNSVEAEKSGTAFGVALLGTIANRVYQDEFAGDAAVRSMGQNDDLAPVLTFVGDGAGNAGEVVGQVPAFVAVPTEFLERVQEVSARAFAVGLDRAVVVAGVAMLAAALVSHLLIKDAAFAPPVALPSRSEQDEPVALAAD